MADTTLAKTILEMMRAQLESPVRRAPACRDDPELARLAADNPHNRTPSPRVVSGHRIARAGRLAWSERALHVAKRKEINQ
jgi:hypothetical protein